MSIPLHRFMRMNLFAIVMVIVVVLSACSDDDSDSGDEQADRPATSTPTITPSPTATIEPSPSPQPTEVAANEADRCTAIVQNAYDITAAACDDTAVDQVCYGNAAVTAQPADLDFDETGDIVDLASLQGLRLSSMDTTTEQWGISLMRIRANLPDEAAEHYVELLLFGDVEIETEPEGTSSGASGATQAFYFRTGVDDRPCAAAPDSGILVQTPKGVGEITLLVNEVTIDLGSTAYLQSQPNAAMTISVVEGQATVTAAGASANVPAGNRVQVPTDATGQAAAPPGPVEPYTPTALQPLPVRLLTQPVVIAGTQPPGQVDAVIGLGNAETILVAEGDFADEGTDQFTFAAQAGQAVYFEITERPEECCEIEWQLVGETGDREFSAYLSRDQEVTIPQAGTYTISLNAVEDFTGEYAFQIHNIPASDDFPLEIGVETRAAADGSGQIEAIGARDIYQFEGTAGQRLYFERLSDTPGCCDIEWRLLAPDGTRVFQQYFISDAEITLPIAGDYTLVLDGVGTYTGDYRFQTYDIPPAENFDLLVNPPGVQEDTPVNTGSLESIGARDILSFQGAAGTRLRFENLSDTPTCCDIEWTLLGPQGSRVFSAYLSAAQEVTLPANGAYTLMIDGVGTYTGDYQLRVYEAGTDEESEIELGEGTEFEAALLEDIIGEIEDPGGSDSYTFEATAGQSLYFEITQPTETCCEITWTLSDSEDDVVFDTWFSSDQELTLETSGTYTLRLSGNDNFSGGYGFRIHGVPSAQNFAIDPGDTVAPDEPDTGAGDLEAIGAQDVYTFTVDPGQAIYLEALEGPERCCPAEWILRAPDG
ncbi:MAG: hypothetical protein GYB66_13820, partial [Chloroflexi bacterium]|nr:hypothetical protein [Chloroflexota bacterium]